MKLKNTKAVSFTLLWIGVPVFLFTLYCIFFIEITLVNYFHVVAALVAIGSLVNFSHSVDLKKDQYTFSVISEVYKRDMSEIFAMLRRTFSDKKFDLSKANINSFLSYFDENDGLEAAVTKMLNFLEAFSALVNEGLINEKLSKKFMRGIVIKTYQEFLFYIDYNQKKQGQGVWCEFVKLSLKWIELEKKH